MLLLLIATVWVATLVLITGVCYAARLGDADARLEAATGERGGAQFVALPHEPAVERRAASRPRELAA
jgi:hypothetical protein